MIYAILIGLLVGAVAKFLMPGKDPGGIIVTILIGVAGSTIAHWIGSAAGMYQPGEPVGFVAAVIGSIILLVVYRMIIGRRGV